MQQLRIFQNGVHRLVILFVYGQDDKSVLLNVLFLFILTYIPSGLRRQYFGRSKLVS